MKAIRPMDLDFFREMLDIDSTSGRELALSEFICERVSALGCSVERFPVGDGTQNLLLSWGEPRMVFCTHMDTVPPYIHPRLKDDVFHGRGTCDAKGQIFAMLEACKALHAQGKTGFALLLLSGEETGSFGAKAFAKLPFKAPYLVVGEPTDNCMASACKGTKAFGVSIQGCPVHSGYPDAGLSAVNLFNDWVNALKAVEFPADPKLGPTTWNIGRLVSDNPQNILSPALEFRIYFRTTFASDAMVEPALRRISDAVVAANPAARISLNAFGGDTPADYLTLEGIASKVISFGSDAPHLTNFQHKAICGPGSILNAHTPNEKICLKDIEKAVDQYIAMYNNWVR